MTLDEEPATWVEETVLAVVCVDGTEDEEETDVFLSDKALTNKSPRALFS